MNKKSILNWVLKEELQYVELVNKNLKTVLKEYQIPFSGLQGYLKWDKLDSVFTINYDKIEDDVISKKLNRSMLCKYDNINLDLDGSNNHFYKIETEVLIRRWNELLSTTGYEGMLAFTDDGKCFLEFMGDHKPLLLTNFDLEW